MGEMGRILYLPGVEPTLEHVSRIAQEHRLGALTRMVHANGGRGLYWPTMSPIALSSIAQLLSDERPVYHAEALGMVYDVSRAQQLVARKRARTVAHLPITQEHLETMDVDSKRVLTLPVGAIREPGILFTYWDVQTDQPMFQLIDGNHRYVRAAIEGHDHIPVYPLTPGEARRCEWFFAIHTGQRLARPRYRWFEDTSEGVSQ